MAAIAGFVHFGSAPFEPAPNLIAMSSALGHRGPDGGTHLEPGLGLAWRRLHTTPAPAVGRNEDGSILALCQGHLTNARALDAALGSRGHRLRSHTDAERIAHLWEEHREDLFGWLTGQFALAVWDQRQRVLVLGRDRVGLSPLHWAQRGPWLLFASEIKGLLASGLITPRPDRWGIDHVFTFIGMPAARTCFEGVQALLPGHYLKVKDGKAESVRYWDLDFPDQGQEDDSRDEKALTDRLEGVLLSAVERSLQPPGPVASYVSGGIDCSTVVALAQKARGDALPTFTIRLETPHLDESERALRAARAGGSEPLVLSCGPRDIATALPRLVEAAESPILDSACALLLLLAEKVRAAGHAAVLAGDGADDLFAGYPWFKRDRRLRLLDWLPGIRPSQWLRRGYLRIMAPHIPWSMVRRIQSLVGGHHAWNDLYGLVSLSRSRYYSAAMKENLAGRVAYEDLTLNLDRLRHWHPLNQALYIGMKVQVPGLLLHAKGDRINMAAGVQHRCPFLDEEVIAFSSALHPRWKLRGLSRDKYLLRRVAARYLPPDIVRRPKSDFVAPFDSTYDAGAPPFVNELLSEESMRRAGYFDPAAVHHWRQRRHDLRATSPRRISVELGLGGIVATQLWHHTFIEGLCSLPRWQAVSAAPAPATHTMPWPAEVHGHPA